MPSHTCTRPGPRSRQARPRPPFRIAAAAVALIAVGGCGDPVAPPDEPTLRPGVYALRGTAWVSTQGWTVVQAETLFVDSALTYRVHGRYELRYAGDQYHVSEPRTPTATTVEGQLRLVLPGLLNGYGEVPAEVYRDSVVLDLTASHGAGRYVYDLAAPPPPPGPVVALQLLVEDTVMVHGGALDVGALVVRGVDATGRWVRDPAVTTNAPPGWTVGADGRLVAPAADAIGNIVLRSGEATATVRVGVVPDLRRTRWRARWSCSTPISAERTASLGDSVYMDVRTDSARYAPTGPSPDGFPFFNGGVGSPLRMWAVAALYASGTRTRWMNGAPVADDIAVVIPVLAQHPDSMLIHMPSYVDRDHYTLRWPVPLPRVADAPRVFGAELAAPTMCPDLTYTRGGTVRLEELP